MKKNEIIISVDTTVLDGSLAVWKNGQEVVSLNLDKTRPISANFVTDVSGVFEEKKLAIGDLKTILYTRGPGSYTGLRVGIASIQGLGRALNCDLKGFTLFEVLSYEMSGYTEFITAVRVCSGKVCFVQNRQGHIFKTDTEIRVLERSEFIEFLYESELPCITSRDLYRDLKSSGFGELSKLKYASDNTAKSLYFLYESGKFNPVSNLPIYI